MRRWIVLGSSGWVLSLWCCLLSGCGGRAVTEGKQGETTDGDGTQSTPVAQSGERPGPDESGSGSDLDSTLELDDCDGGWLQGEAPCPWLASDGVCYPTKEAACACICPDHGMTVCSSGLPGGEDDRVRVSCS